MRLGRKLFMVMTCIILGALMAAGAAQASDSTVRAAIETSGKQIKENSELQQALTELKDNPKTIAKLQKGLKEFETALTKVVRRSKLRKPRRLPAKKARKTGPGASAT